MPLKKLIFKPGVNRENTRYTTEGGFYDCDKIRFRQGTPEKIGGWSRFSTNTFLGICRAIWNWVNLAGNNLIGVGTNLKYYIESGTLYYDITPLRTQSTAITTVNNPFTTTAASTTVTVTDAGSNVNNGDVVVITGLNDLTTYDGIPGSQLNGRHVVTRVSGTQYTFTVTTPATAGAAGIGGSVTFNYFKYKRIMGANPFATVSGSRVVTVTDNSHGLVTTNFVIFSNVTTFNGVNLNGEFEVVVINSNTYRITAPNNASGTGSGGGSTIYVEELIDIGSETQVTRSGWSGGPWGSGAWGIGVPSTNEMALWTHSNFGEDLLINPRYGAVYYWDATSGLTSRAVDINTLAGASSCPIICQNLIVSDVSRFVFAMGTNDYDSAILDPLLIRWSDQESITQWTPSATNQAGSLRLSQGSQIISALQVRQEILVWTNSSVYSLQYVGVPAVWGSTLLGDNLSIAGPNAKAVASGVVYWMGNDKFYKYDGRVDTLRCDLREYIFNDINNNQNSQVFAGTNEGFNEVWWFYCSRNSSVVDKYVIYNYLEDIWYYGRLGRTAWIDSGLRDFPIAATYDHNLVNHENGVNDNTLGTNAPINAYIESSQFDIDDGHNFGFIWRMIPDITFRGSNATTIPTVTMTLTPYQNSGSGPNTPASQGGSDNAQVTRSAIVPVEEFTGQVYVRVRGRQMSFKIESNQVGNQWQLGAPRIDIKPDGRR